MSIFDRLFNRTPKATPEEKRLPRGFSFIAPWQIDQPHYTIVDVDTYISDGFNANSLIYSALMYKYRALSSAPLRAYTGDPDNADPLPPTSPLAQLVKRPNLYQSGAAFIGLVDIWLNLAGSAPVLILRDSGGVPSSLVPLNPAKLGIIPSKEIGPDGTPILGYVYKISGRDDLPILRQDLAMPKFPNPGDPLGGWGFGLSPLSSGAKSADVDNRITDFLAKFFESGTMINTLLKYDIPLSDTEIARIRERWKEIYGGWQNMGDIGIMDAHGEIVKLGYDFNEMGFGEIDSRNESRILAPFGVPPILIGSRMGLERSTYSNYEEARRAFWQDVALPEQHIIEDELAWFLASPEGFVMFDNSQVPALKADIGPLVTAFAQLVSTGVPKATAAGLVGLDIGDLPDGETVYMPLNLVPFGEQKPEPATPTTQADNSNQDERTNDAEQVVKALKIAVEALQDAPQD